MSRAKFAHKQSLLCAKLYGGNPIGKREQHRVRNQKLSDPIIHAKHNKTNMKYYETLSQQLSKGKHNLKFKTTIKTLILDILSILMA